MLLDDPPTREPVPAHQAAQRRQLSHVAFLNRLLVTHIFENPFEHIVKRSLAVGIGVRRGQCEALNGRRWNPPSVMSIGVESGGYRMVISFMNGSKSLGSGLGHPVFAPFSQTKSSASPIR